MYKDNNQKFDSLVDAMQPTMQKYRATEMGHLDMQFDDEETVDVTRPLEMIVETNQKSESVYNTLTIVFLILTCCFISIAAHKAGSYYNKQKILSEEIEEALENLKTKR